MKRNEFISGRLKEVLIDGKWIANTNYKDQLENLDWSQATEKNGNLNSIASITYHVTYYLKGFVTLFESGHLDIRDKYSFDMQPITCESDWKSLLTDFIDNSNKIIEHIRQLNEDKLEDIFVEEKYGTYHRNLEGMIEHCYYHLGQITLLKKMILDKDKKDI
ncbi:DinB family protein [Algoriphagus confluentis]|uniref:DUF1572 domain-containing protein n=1 Tax=Algoriphagus confluentis TaxID=1697556 RepID=A0ABQ6PNS5_9BACT|nr:hypothetical protein Aconfl_22250 [Algoriphagus confluentis]